MTRPTNPGSGSRPSDVANTQSIRFLLDAGIVPEEEWAELPPAVQTELLAVKDLEAALAALVSRHLLTRFQAETVAQGRGRSLLLGQYRLVEPLGRGGMGAVYRAEHRFLRKPVAVKIMEARLAADRRGMDRFRLEARAANRLQHPGLVSCIDAGQDGPHPPWGDVREYYVMDLVLGADLGATVAANGPLSVPRASALFRQIADALAETHRFGLVHRDVKPSNILITPDWRGKLLDFGLAHHGQRDLTEPGTFLGSVGFMAPEQIENPSRVDGRADVFGLGASLFLALTGVEPFADNGPVLSALSKRLTTPSPRVRGIRPDLPVDLDELVARMMEPDRERRFPSATAVAAALISFTRRQGESVRLADHSPTRPRVLIIDDDEDVRLLLRSLLEPEYDYAEAVDGRSGLALVERDSFDLVVVDHEMPRLDGARLIAHMTKETGRARPMVLYMSGRMPTESLGGLLLAGADDFIRKPFTSSEFLSRIRGLLNRSANRSAAESGIPRGGSLPEGGSRSVPPSQPAARPTDSLCGSTTAPARLLAEGICQLLEEKGGLSRGYHARLPQYLRALAQAVRQQPGYALLASLEYVETLAQVAPAHDAGLLTLAPELLTKEGKLSEEETMALQSHTMFGARLFTDLVRSHPESATALKVAAEIAQTHHEHWNGSGHPDGLQGDAIPVAGRLVALASTYDAFRTRSARRPGLSHPSAVRVITTARAAQFDPVLVEAFVGIADAFDRVFQSTAG